MEKLSRSSEPILTASTLTKRFGATVALSNLDFSIHPGEVVALMGANGAGKSTLVKILSGVYAPDGGTLTLLGKPYRPASPQAAKQLGIATVHQSIADAVVPTLSIADNLLLDRLCDPASPWRVPPAARREAARPLAERVGLDVDLSGPLGSLSLATALRLTSTSVDENLNADYVRTATSKGLSRKRVIGAHVLRNSLIPVVTFIGVELGNLMTGAIVTETIFNVPGIGRALQQAINQQDGPTVVTIVSVLVIVFLVANLVVDLLYAVLDPRIRYS